MDKGRNGIKTFDWVIDKKMTDQIDSLFGRLWPEYFIPVLLANRGEFELWIRRVHAMDLFFRRCPKHFDNFNELVNAWLSWEERLADE